MTDENETVPWPWAGVEEHTHAAQSSEAINARLVYVYWGLDLVAHMIGMITHNINTTEKATNLLAALAAYTRAFRAIRAATLLATSGLYLEARVYARDVYESASLARMLALRDDKADQWLLANRWIKDNEVRQYIQNVTAPGVPLAESPYVQYYKVTSDLHHPTARACLPLVLSSPELPCTPALASEYDEETLDLVLAEIALECGFVCLSMINAAVHPDVIPPDWHEAVTRFVTETGQGQDWSHLERDWEAATQRYAELGQHIITGDELTDALEHHPNSYTNLQARRNQTTSESST